jgi:hypothetical protein
MNDVQMEKVRRIVEKLEAMPAKHDVGCWVENDCVYVAAKAEQAEVGATACLYAIDRSGKVSHYRNYSPLQLRNNSLIMTTSAGSGGAHGYEGPGARTDSSGPRDFSSSRVVG